MTMTKFETITCTRCNGTGHHSYCETHGTRCFKCAGRGRVLTPRGIAARHYFDDLCSKPAGEVVAGDLIQINDFGRKCFSEVVNVDPDYQITADVKTIALTTKQMRIITSADKPQRMGQSAEQKQAKFADALAYQDTLTKKGTVRKRKAR